MTFSEREQLSLFRDWCRGFNLQLWTSDDVWTYFRVKYPRFHKWISEPDHWNYVGSFCSQAKQSGLVEEVGRKPSSRPQAKARQVTIYRWRDSERKREG